MYNPPKLKKKGYLDLVTGNKKKRTSQGPPDRKINSDEKENNEKPQWKYEGETNEEGLPHGVGKLISLTSDEFYEGQWFDGKKDGFGTQQFVTGEKYQGQWKDDRMHGEGSVSYQNNDTFQGEWCEGERLRGRYTFRIGDLDVTYYEQWHSDIPGPSGVLEYSNGSKYFGDIGFTVDKDKFTIKHYLIHRHGYGEMLWHNKNKYIGNWKNDLRKGFGVFIEAETSRKYYGNWVRSKQSGDGVEVFPDGAYYDGKFLHGERKGKGSLFIPNGDTLTGDWSNFKLNPGNYINRKFTDVPRTLRSLFLFDVTAIQKLEDTKFFTTERKWSQLVGEALAKISPENCELAHVGISLLEDFQVLKDKGLGLESLTQVVDRFIHIFNIEYNPKKSSVKKDRLYILQTAVDDLNSFITCLTSTLEQKLGLNSAQKRTLNDTVTRAIFPKIYDVLFYHYQQVNRMTDALLRSKIVQLKECTPALIGVKERFHLNPKEDKKENEIISDTVIELKDNVKEFIKTNSRNMHSSVSTPNFTPIQEEVYPSKARSRIERLNTGDGKPSIGSSRQNPRPHMTQRHSMAIPKPIPKTTTNIQIGPRLHRRLSSEIHTHKLEDETPETPNEKVNNTNNYGTKERSMSVYTWKTDKSENSISWLDEKLVPIGAESDIIRETKKIVIKENLPYQRVIEALENLNTSKTPISKLDCLSKAAQGILSCVDEYFTDKKERILMGAEDKFPVLIYALIRANVCDLWCHCYFLQDFVFEHVGDEESRYRVSELSDALKYVQSLDWMLRDQNNVLIPLKMLVSSVSWSVKGVEKLKFPDYYTDPDETKTEILLGLSQIFREISQRTEKLYTPYRVPDRITQLVRDFEIFYTSIMSSKELGLKIRCEGRPDGEKRKYWIDFELKHPLYIYAEIAKACVAPSNS